MTDKPPYLVPSMDEIRALPWNGFNAVSTFSGCGGSSLGYRMAGFRMLWASEFVPAAQETYRANAAPHTVLDTRDIREVTGRDILDATGLGVGEIDLFDGSPPCSPFSTVGIRAKGWGAAKKYSDTQQRVDDLFFEYVRLIEQTQPRVFVAENVSGLVKGSAKGYFKLILSRLKACGYRVTARLLDASWLGVPQARQRLIFVGVRDDLGMDPAHPSPLPYQYVVRDALPWIVAQGDNGGFGSGAWRSTDRHPSPTILTGPSNGNKDYPPGHVLSESGPEGTFVTHDPETRQVLSVKGYAIETAWRNTPPGGSSERYFSLKRTHPDRPSQTVLATGGNSTGRCGLMHWHEPRKFTLGELRAISGFPADFVLTGTYAQRWERIGRAVPPVMMSHIAAVVRDKILVPLREAGTI